MRRPTGSIFLADAVHHHRDGSVTILSGDMTNRHPDDGSVAAVVSVQVPWPDDDRYHAGDDVAIELELWLAKDLEERTSGALAGLRTEVPIPERSDLAAVLPPPTTFTDARIGTSLEEDRLYIVLLKVDGDVVDWAPFDTYPLEQPPSPQPGGD